MPKYKEIPRRSIMAYSAYLMQKYLNNSNYTKSIEYEDERLLFYLGTVQQESIVFIYVLRLCAEVDEKCLSIKK